MRLQSDLVDIFDSIAAGSLAETTVDWSDESSACVVLASRGYPGKYESGAAISGLEGLPEDLQVFHAGTSRSEAGDFVTAGGRVLGITAFGADLDAALSRCYNAISRIHWAGMQYRRDIGRFGNSSLEQAL